MVASGLILYQCHAYLCCESMAYTLIYLIISVNIASQ
jgi:hypothetical protein